MTKSINSFQEDFKVLLTLLKNKTPFAFNRFSDGELFILQNKDLVLDNNLIQVGSSKTSEGAYQKEDFKRFSPREHSFYRDKLIESYRFNKENYFKGLSSSNCVGKNDFKWQLDFLHHKINFKYLTWANLLVNANYRRFIGEIYPSFQEYKTIFICNQKADLSSMPFIVKDFRVGYNAMINDYPLIEKIKDWIKHNNIESHLFLFSASSFSKMAIHQLYDFCDKNTYIDVGTTLNPFMNMRLDRSYLKSYWLNEKGEDINKIDIW